MLKCERGSTNPQKMQQKTATNFFMDNVYVFNIESICIHGEELLRKFTLQKKNREQSHSETDVRQSEKFISEQSDEICGVNTITGKILHGNIWSLVGDEQVISLLHTKVYVFSDSVLCLGKMNENPQSNISHGKTDWRGTKVHQSTELWTELMVSQWNSSGKSSQDSPHWSSATKSKSYCRISAQSQKISQDGSFSCQCLTTSHDDPKKMNGNAN